MLYFKDNFNSYQVSPFTHFNNKLLIITFFVFLIFSSCKEQIEIGMPTDDEFFTDDELPVIDPCPLGKYNGIVVNYQDSREEVDALGATVIHSWFQWDFVEQNLTTPFLTEEDVTEEMIEEYATGEREGIDWTFIDNHVNKYEGLELIMGIGSGWENSLPLFNEEKITPDIIGRDEYIGQLYLHTRACVRRYKDKVSIWQIENEPNISEILIALGHRKGNSWNDNNFMTRVLSMLERAVRAEDSDALVAINFFIDVTDYQTDINRWISMIDIVGVDSYQDIFNKEPISAADTILNRIKNISNLTEGKPVMILETGYSSGPEGSGFSEENQKIFIKEIYSRMDDFNGCGTMYFKHSTSEQNTADLFPSKHYRGLIKENNEGKLSWHFLKDFFQ